MIPDELGHVQGVGHRQLSQGFEGQNHGVVAVGDARGDDPLHRGVCDDWLDARVEQVKGDKGFCAGIV